MVFLLPNKYVDRYVLNATLFGKLFLSVIR